MTNEGVRISFGEQGAEELFESHLKIGEETKMKPSIGRIVHYIGGVGRHYPAIITRVQEKKEETAETVSLQVFGGFTPELVTSVPFDDFGAIATWHWPEKVE